MTRGVMTKELGDALAVMLDKHDEAGVDVSLFANGGEVTIVVATGECAACLRAWHRQHETPKGGIHLNLDAFGSPDVGDGVQ